MCGIRTIDTICLSFKLNNNTTMARIIQLIATCSALIVFLFACSSSGKDTSDTAPTNVPMSKAEAKTQMLSLVSEWKTTTQTRLADVYHNKVAKNNGLSMPLWWTTYGTKPANGYSLYISLHGGGGAAASVNDQQWENQKLLYKPSDCIYLAPRAPMDTWDMWFHEGIDTLYEETIQMAEAFLDVDPNRVYIMGYSAGGDGVWREAPRMADSWAAASMMAGHPGDVSLVNLRNTPFMIWCGELDSAYHRNVVDAQRGAELDSLQKDDPEGYVHQTTIVKGKSHWMDLVDAAAVPWMAQYTRNPYPKKVVWQQEEVLRKYFYWLSAPLDELKRGMTVRTRISGNTIEIQQCDYSTLTILLNDELVDLDNPVIVVYKGKEIFNEKVDRTISNMKLTLSQRNDPSYIFPAVIHLKF